MYYWLNEKLVFPAHELADEDGVLALGGDLSIERLLLAYQNGIFPWYNEFEPIVWYTPPERMVLFPEELKISKSMRKVLRQQNYTITQNKAFEQVIQQCKSVERKDQEGTWITNDMLQAYIKLHKKGYAHSIEIWQNNNLVAGLYGVATGNGVFCGESMFSLVSNMSKVAFIHLAQNCGYQLIDCQVHNNHLASLGAKEIPRSDFLKILYKKNGKPILH